MPRGRHPATRSMTRSCFSTMPCVSSRAVSSVFIFSFRVVGLPARLQRGNLSNSEDAATLKMSYDRIMAIAESPSPTTSRLPHVDLLELARQRLIVALDVPDAASAARLVSRLEGTCTWFKVGLELFVAAGPAVLEPLLKQG